MVGWLGRLGLAAIAAGLCLEGGEVAAASGPDLSIGFIGTLSGSGANVAQDQLDGFKLGIKHSGGRIGGADFTLTVIDDKHDPDIDRRAAKQLIDQGHVQIILVSSQAPVSTSLAAMVTSAHSFLIVLNDPSSRLAGRDCQTNLFSLAPLDETLQAMSGLYLQTQGYKSVALVAPDTPGARQAEADFAKQFKGKVILLTNRPGTMNFAETFVDLRRAAPDAVYLLHNGGMAVNFIIQYQKAGLKGSIPLYGPAGTFDQTVLAAAGGAAADLFSTAPWSGDFDTPSNRRLVADFEVEYGRPASIYAAYGYDAAMLLDRAVASIDRKFNDSELLRTALRRVDFPATRAGFHFDTNHLPIETYVVRQVVQDETRARLSNEQRGVLMKDVRDGHAGECPMRWTPEPVLSPKG